MSNLAPSISLIPSALMNSSHLCKYRLKLWICSQRLGAQGWLWGLLIWNLAIVFLDFDFTLSFVMGMQTLKVNWACTQNSICYFQETEESGELFIFMHLRQNNCSAALSEYFGKSKSGDSGTSFLCLLFQITQKIIYLGIVTSQISCTVPDLNPNVVAILLESFCKKYIQINRYILCFPSVLQLNL